MRRFAFTVGKGSSHRSLIPQRARKSPGWIFLAWCCWFLATPLFAHGEGVVARIALMPGQESTLWVELRDAYGNPVPEARVQASLAAPGKQPQSWVVLGEAQPGLHRAAFVPVGKSDELHLTIIWPDEEMVAQIPLAAAQESGGISVPLRPRVTPVRTPYWIYALLAGVAGVLWGIWEMFRRRESAE